MRGPSPFRLVLHAVQGTPRTVDCPRSIQALPGAKRYAQQWAADVGVAGTIDLEQRLAPWPCERFERIATAEVSNSKITKWPGIG